MSQRWFSTSGNVKKKTDWNKSTGNREKKINNLKTRKCIFHKLFETQEILMRFCFGFDLQKFRNYDVNFNYSSFVLYEFVVWAFGFQRNPSVTCSCICLSLKIAFAKGHVYLHLHIDVISFPGRKWQLIRCRRTKVDIANCIPPLI